MTNGADRNLTRRELVTGGNPARRHRRVLRSRRSYFRRLANVHGVYRVSRLTRYFISHGENAPGQVRRAARSLIDEYLSLLPFDARARRHAGRDELHSLRALICELKRTRKVSRGLRDRFRYEILSPPHSSCRDREGNNREQIDGKSKCAKRFTAIAIRSSSIFGTIRTRAISAAYIVIRALRGHPVIFAEFPQSSPKVIRRVFGGTRAKGS